MDADQTPLDRADDAPWPWLVDGGFAAAQRRAQVAAALVVTLAEQHYWPWRAALDPRTNLHLGERALRALARALAECTGVTADLQDCRTVGDVWKKMGVDILE